MADNSQSRKWQLTINSIDKIENIDEIVKDVLSKFVLDYYCFCQEIGNKTHNKHMHIFMYSHTSPIRFSTIKNRFSDAELMPHIEKAYGNVQQNIDYIKKEGRFADTDKSETSIEGSFYEYGVIPSQGQELDPKMYQLIEDIKDGKTTMQIIEENPSLAFRIKDIDTIRQTYLANKYSKENRDLTVFYLYGASGSGKTRSIYEKYGAENICRITNYSTGRGVLFDNYQSNDVLVLEEYHSNIEINFLLNLLDIYPLMLPARYNDKVACYTKVIITSNISLDQQYAQLRYSVGKMEVLNALERRIHNIIEFKKDGTTIEHKMTKKEE